MTLEPRAVEDGYAKRWTHQSLDLVFRSFHWWFGIQLGLCLLLALLPFGGLLALPAGVFAYALSCDLASLSDRSAVSLNAVLTSARACLGYAGRLLWANRIALLLAMALSFALVFGLASMAKDSAATPAPAVDYRSIWTWVFAPHSPFLTAAAALWVGSFMAAGFARRAPMLRYCLASWAGEEQADICLEKAWRKNVLPVFFIEMLHMAALALTLFLLPIATPFLLCFLPAVSYVAFREMFIDDQGNQPVKTAQRRHELSLTGARG